MRKKEDDDMEKIYPDMISMMCLIKEDLLVYIYIYMELTIIYIFLNACSGYLTVFLNNGLNHKFKTSKSIFVNIFLLFSCCQNFLKQSFSPCPDNHALNSLLTLFLC